MKRNQIEQAAVWHDKKRNAFGLPWTFTNYFLTENKIIIKTGALTITKDEIDLYRITDKKVVQTLMGRIFGYGSLVLYSRDTNNSVIELKNIKDPEKTADEFGLYIDNERDKYNIRGKDMYGSGFYTK